MPAVRDVTYEVDGMTMVGSLGVPDQPGPRPAVLVAHEANGLDVYQKGRARRLAELGYVAFALDYQGGGTPPEFAVAQARTAGLGADAERMRARSPERASTSCSPSRRSTPAASPPSGTASAARSSSSSAAPAWT